MATVDNQDFSMQYDSALGIAKAIDDKRLDFNGMCETLENLVDSLDGQWEGKAQYEFQTAYKNLKSKLSLISKTMEAYSTEIRTAVQSEQDTEEESSGFFDWLSLVWSGNAAQSGSRDRGNHPNGPSKRGTRREGMQNTKNETKPKSNHAQKQETKPSIDELEERLEERKDNYSKRKDIRYVEVAPQERKTVVDQEHVIAYSESGKKMVVKKGYITYVDQYNSSNGWGSRFGDHWQECCTACQSMALSYLGISRTPEELLNTWRTHDNGCGSEVRGTPEATQSFRWGWDQAEFTEKLNAFEADRNQGKTSPVLIHYQYAGSMHWVMVVGQESDNTYRVIGPVGSFKSGGSEKCATVKIENGRISCVDGKLSGLESSDCVGTLDGMVQYYSKD